MGMRSALNSDQFTQGCVQLNLKTSQDNLPRQLVSIFTFSHCEDFFFLNGKSDLQLVQFSLLFLPGSICFRASVDPRKSPLASWKPFLSWLNNLIYSSASPHRQVPPQCWWLQFSDIFQVLAGYALINAKWNMFICAIFQYFHYHHYGGIENVFVHFFGRGPLNKVLVVVKVWISSFVERDLRALPQPNMSCW